MSERLRICFVVASARTVQVFLKAHLIALTLNYDVHVVVSPGGLNVLSDLRRHLTIKEIEIRRRISPLRDLAAVAALLRLFWVERYTCVHSVTPKAGLLGMLAAWLAGVPHRVHTFTGQVWVTRAGIARSALKLADRVLAGLTTLAIVDSPSQCEFLINEGVLKAEKARVISKGGICGVDENRFAPDSVAREEIRGELGIAPEALVLLFVGRLKAEKGVVDLLEAFLKLRDRFDRLFLLLVGPDEEALLPRIRALASSEVGRRSFEYVGYTENPERYMAAADILCLPSYREGFGMVIIEAAAVGLPAVASCVYGITDAVVHGQTGVLHRPRCVNEIVQAANVLLSDAALRQEMGERARKRAIREFSAKHITGKFVTLYDNMLERT